MGCNPHTLCKLGKSETRGNSEAQATGTTPLLNRSGTRRVLKLCIIQVFMFPMFDWAWIFTTFAA